MAFSDSTASAVCSDWEAYVRHVDSDDEEVARYFDEMEDIQVRQLDIDDEERVPYFDEILEVTMPSFWLFLNSSERAEFLATNWHLYEMIQVFLDRNVALFPRPDYSQYRVI